MLAAISAKLYLYFGYAWIAQTTNPTPIYSSMSETIYEIKNSQNVIPPKLTLMKNEIVYILLKQYRKNNWLCFIRDKMYNFGWTPCYNLLAIETIINISKNSG